MKPPHFMAGWLNLQVNFTGTIKTKRKDKCWWCVCVLSLALCSPTRLLCPWHFPGKNTGVGAIASSKGPSPTSGRALASCIDGGSLTTGTTWEAQGSVRMWGVWNICHSWWGCKVLHPLWKPVWQFFRRLGMELPWDPEIPRLGAHVREMKTHSTQKLVNKCA